MARVRRLLEPRDRLDRFLYATFAVMGPGMFMSPLWTQDGMFFPLVVLAFWWVVCAFYTLDALVDGFERWRRAP